MNSDFVEIKFCEPWRRLNTEQVEFLLREAQREISPGHPLHGSNLIPIAQSRLADDVLFKLDDDHVTDIHLTWSRNPEPPPFPRCRIYSSFDEWSARVMIPDSEME
jgi:hypothetical protein